MKKSKNNSIFRSNVFVLIIITIVVAFIFWLGNHNFLSEGNFRNIMISMSADGLYVLGAAICLIAGEVDLSSGAVACFCSIVFGLATNAGIFWPISMILGLLVGAGFGLLHAVLVNNLKMMSFLATLAAGQIYRGFAVLITANKNFQVDKSVTAVGTTFWIIPLPFIIMVAIMIGYGVMMRKRRLGRSIYLVGGNRESARLSGTNPRKVSYFVYLNNGIICALAGIMVAARMHISSPNTGTGAETDAITGAVLGGVSFMGGSGTLAGCFVGVLLLDVFSVGLTAVGFPSYWQMVAKGILLILALVIDYFMRTAREKRMR